MERRRWITLAALGWAWLYARGARGEGRLDVAEIKAALRTTGIEENGFVERAVALVDEGVLPQTIVEATLQWARRKPKNRFQYFKRALIIQAAKLGIEIS